MFLKSCLPLVYLLFLILSACVDAQEGIIILQKTNDKIAYFFHREDGTVTASGWLFENTVASDTSLEQQGPYLSLAQRKRFDDGSPGSLEIMTWKGLSGGSEVYFPDFSEAPYQMPVMTHIQFGNCNGFATAKYSADMSKMAGIQAVGSRQLRVSFTASPLDIGVLFLQEQAGGPWKYLEAGPATKLSEMVDCSELKTGVQTHSLQFPAGSIVQGQVTSDKDAVEYLVYKLLPNFEGQLAPPVLVPEILMNDALTYDFTIIPAQQRNLFLGRRIYRLLGNDLAALDKIQLPSMELTKEYVTEGGFSVDTKGSFEAMLAVYGLEIPNTGQTASVNKRSQWRIFGPAEEGKIEMRLPEIPKPILQELTGKDYVRVYNSVAIHLYQFREGPGKGAFKKMAKLLEGQLDGHEDRIEYRAWIKELD